VAAERDFKALWQASERVVGTLHPRDLDADVDRYGREGAATRLEDRVASLLGKEAALWLPSGTMAQQIALRIHADRHGSRTVAFHPTCHLDLYEERGYERLHGLHARLLGERYRLIEPSDLELHEPVAAVLLELPQRELGGRLPAWDDLIATCAAARELGAALHLDGARLWQCGPFYGRGLDEIAALFDTVYVSFYKDLRAPAGCALAGPRDLIDEARVWQIRHGGRMFSVLPLLLAAERGLDEVLPRMPELVAHAAAIGRALAALDDLSVVPDPPQAALLHVHVRRPLAALKDASLEVAERTRTWVAGNWGATEDPAVQATELAIGLPALEVSPDEVASLYAEVLDAAAAGRP
jgi:threonine aldolase